MIELVDVSAKGFVVDQVAVSCCVFAHKFRSILAKGLTAEYPFNERRTRWVCTFRIWRAEFVRHDDLSLVEQFVGDFRGSTIQRLGPSQTRDAGGGGAGSQSTEDMRCWKGGG